MNEIEINQILNKAMGKCWHEWISTRGGFICIATCKSHFLGFSKPQANPSYTSSWQAYGEFLEFAQKQDWWDEFLVIILGWGLDNEFYVLLNPLQGSTAFAKFLKGRK